jgi:ribosomal protein L21E
MLRISAFSLAVALTCLAGPGAGRAGEVLINPEELTAGEQAAVRKLAEGALKERGLLKGKVYLTGIEVFHDSVRGARHAVATHYRYDGDLGIRTHIDLGTRKVTEVEEIPHLPTSLAPEELAEAEKLARANKEVARALARYAKGPKIEVDAQMAITALSTDPNYQHRVVRLAFHRGREYLLYVPHVDVDLTTGTVRVQPVGKGHD